MPLSARLAFAHAALQVIAAEERVDILHIKGVAVDASIGTVAGSGSDADVLVRPSHIPLLLEQLERRGWQHYSDFESGSPFGHAATFFHDSWGFGDIHRNFPGIGLAADEAFEQLWSARTTRPLAGIPCTVPSLAAQLLIMVLNAARSGGASSRMALVRTVWDETPPEPPRAGDCTRREPARGGCLQRRSGRAGALSGTSRVPALEGRLAGGHPAGGMGRPSLGSAHASSERSGWRLRAPLVNTEHLAIRIGHQPTRVEVLREFVARPVRGVNQELGASARGAADGILGHRDRYARPADVAMVVEDRDDEDGVVVYLAPLPEGPVQVLNGVGSLIWLDATSTDTPVDVVERVAALVDRPPDTIRADVDSFLADLVAAGLLERLDV